MTAEEIEALFTRTTGEFFFARWGRAIVPVVFGVEDDTLAILRNAFEAVVALAGHEMAAADPELGANLMVFFCRDWGELAEVPDLDRLVDGLDPLLARLTETQATQYRLFRFDPAGAIKAAVVFLRIDADLAAVPADALAMVQAVQAILCWSERAFAVSSPLLPDGDAALRPDIARLIGAAYDPVLPAMAQDPALALRLAARLDRAAVAPPTIPNWPAR